MMLRISKRRTIFFMALLSGTLAVLGSACSTNAGQGEPTAPPQPSDDVPTVLTCTPGEAVPSDDPCALCICSDAGEVVCDVRDVGTACTPLDCCVHGAVCSPCTNAEDCGPSGLRCGGGVRPECTGDEPCLDGASVCVDGQCECTYSPVDDGTACAADSAECTINDSCQAGVCVVGQAAETEDGNPCTAGVCVKGEVVQKALGGPCSDGNPCTTGDTCTLAQCVPTDLKACDPKPCSQSAWCDAEAGGCVYEPEVDGTPCAVAGDFCAAAGTCQAGDCVAQGAASCDDDDVCTTDTCDPATGCKNTLNAPCDDGIWCTQDTCDAELGCVFTNGDACDDGDPCTVDTCAEVGCQYTQIVGCGSTAGVSWNPMDKQENIVLSNGNLTAAVMTDSLNDTVRATSGKDSGLWYWEITVAVSSEGSYNGICVADETLWLELSPGCSEWGANYKRQGSICSQESDPFLKLQPYGQGDVIGVALDADAAQVYFHVNGVWHNSFGPVQPADGLSIGPAGTATWFPCVNLSQGDSYTANFGQTPFAFAPPAGFEAFGL